MGIYNKTENPSKEVQEQTVNYAKVEIMKIAELCKSLEHAKCIR